MLQDLASSPDPRPRYADLQAAAPHRLTDGRWIVARSDDVATVVASPVAVVPPGHAVAPALARGRSQMARFSDGPDHAHRRAAAVEALDEMATVHWAEAVGRLAAGTLAPGVDAVEWARQTIAGVMTAVLGAADPPATAAAARIVTRALAPEAGHTPDDPAIVDAAWLAVVDALPAADEVARVNRAALVHQALDATAGLVAGALLARARGVRGGPGDVVHHALADDPPVLHTLRDTTDDLMLGDGTTIPRGAQVVVVLVGSDAFGVGPHRCPGAAVAQALAGVLVGAALDAGLEVPAHAPRYERRANLRIPARLVFQRVSDVSSPTAS